jgi:hypothetical protein
MATPPRSLSNEHCWLLSDVERDVSDASLKKGVTAKEIKMHRSFKAVMVVSIYVDF